MHTYKYSAVLSVLLFHIPAAQAQVMPQWLSIGGKVGTATASPTNVSDIHGSDASQWVQLGPSVEFKLPVGFALEVDALYQRVGYDQSFFGAFSGQNTMLTNYKVRANDWQFPLLGKYYFRSSHKVQPYLAGGVVFGYINNGLSGNSVSIASGTNMITSTPFQSRRFSHTDVAPTAAVGARFKWERFALLPEVRYTHWGDAYPRQKNTASLLMGFQF